jgi:hypothetical protein
VISIVLAGFALSGVVMALARDWFFRHGAILQAILPVALLPAAAIGHHFVTTNPFNPLQLQNQATFVPQLYNIAEYYLALLPFFFGSGLYISLMFIRNDQQIGRVYGYDLTGAGAGALAVLGLMTVVHPFQLVPCLLVPLAFAALITPRHRLPVALCATLALAGSLALLLGDNEAQFNDYKAIYAPLHVPDSKVLSEIRSPRGLYMVLDDFTERVDTDISNNAGLLGLPGPPTSLGLYRDGNRLASLPRPGPIDAGYAGATLAALPYMLHPAANVLLAGSSGGFRPAEVMQLGAARVDMLEPEPLLRRMAGGRPDSPIAAVEGQKNYDIIDLSSDFLDAAEANSSAFAAEAIAAYLRALTPDGMISIPVSIREFPAYAIRMLSTVRAGLLEAGIADPAAHVLVYRSAWNVRILVFRSALSASQLATAKTFCDERSFDISFYPGIDIVAARPNIYNDLPAVSFEAGEVTSGEGAHDAIADEAGAALRGEPTDSARSFDLSPITYDRPSFYAVLRLSRLDLILQRLELLPQAEIGPLVNLAVLAQAVVIAAFVLAVPLLGGRTMRRGGTLRAICFFSALGLGFLFLEIYLIERASFYLNDRTSGFALVLTGMLIFSGLGSMAAHRFAPRRGIALAVGVVMVWGVSLVVGLQPFMLATLGLPWLARAGIVLAIVAPASLALGLPFPLGLARMGSSSFLPWAWGLNGAFSVVSTPLANLIALQAGYSRVLLAALVLYGISLISFPRMTESRL